MRFTGSFQTTVHHGPSASSVPCTLPARSVREPVPGSARGRSTGMHILLSPTAPQGSGGGGDESTGRARSPAVPPRITVDTVTSALLTDLYELTMLEAAREAGTASRRCVFEVFTRSLPEGRRYGALAGTSRVLDAIADFRFDDADLRYLRTAGVLKEETLEHLAEYRFRGDVHGYAEGELYFPNSPVLRIGGTFENAVLLETAVLSILNHDSGVASAGSRMVTAARGRPCIEMGGRRVHEDAAIAAARAAYVVGFASTSNLAAGAHYRVPVAGTAAHAFTLLFDTEEEAFRAQLASQ